MYWYDVQQKYICIYIYMEEKQGFERHMQPYGYETSY